MERLIKVSMFVGFLALEVVQQDVGKECPSPVKCLTENTFTFCSIIEGQPVLQNETYFCPPGYLCVADPYVPCKEAPTTTSTTTTTTVPVVSQLPSNNCTPGSKFVAEKCYQYYECVQFLWWFEIHLKTCFLGQAYDHIKLKCVPIYQTKCKVA